MADFEEIVITPEPRPSITKIKVDTVRILPLTKTAEITLRYTTDDDKPIKEEKLIFMDREDNPETPEDETSTEYTQLITGLDINKTFLKNAIKIKLGICPFSG